MSCGPHVASTVEFALFDDKRVQEILGGSTLTGRERDFLVRETPLLAESESSQQQLQAMSDLELFTHAYGAWTLHSEQQSRWDALARAVAAMPSREVPRAHTQGVFE